MFRVLGIGANYLLAKGVMHDPSAFMNAEIRPNIGKDYKS